jgi:hypothetical protein
MLWCALLLTLTQGGMGTVRVQKVQLKATNQDDVSLISTGSNLVVQQGASNTPTFKVAHGTFYSLRDGVSGLFGETDPQGGYLGLVSSNVRRRVVGLGVGSDEASETGYGTIFARSLQVTDPSLSNSFRIRVDPTDGSLVRQSYASNTWQEVARENSLSATFPGTIIAANIIASNLTINTTKLALSSIPDLPASQITSGSFSVGSFDAPLSTTSSLQASGAASFNSNVSVAGNVAATGSVSCSNGLSVSGSTILASLQASASAMFSCNVSVAGTLITTGASTFVGGLTIPSGSLSVAGAISCSNGLNVSGASASFGSNLTVNGPILSSNSISGTSLASTGNITATGSIGIGTASPAFNLDVAGTIRATGRASLMGSISIPVVDSGYYLYTNYQSLTAPASSNTNGDVYGLGQWPAGKMRAIISAVATSGAAFNVSKPAGASFGGWTDLVTVVGSNGNVGVANTAPSARFQVSGGVALFDSNVTVMSTLSASNLNAGPASLGIVSCTAMNPVSSNAYDIGTSALPWRNATLAGTLSAQTYVGLTRKYWNKYNLGLINETTAYHKIASMLTWVGANNSVIRVCGQFGGEAAFAVLDLYISTRPSPPIYVTGVAYGNVASAKAYGDIAIFYNSNASVYDVYLTSTKQFGSWDLSVEGTSGNVLFEPSSSNTAAPVGTLQNPSTLSRLFSTTETSSNLTSMTTSIACSNLSTAGTVTIAGTDPLYSNKDWVDWTPTASDSNLTLVVNYARACSTNRRATLEFSVQMAFAASSGTTSITLPSGQVVNRTTSATQLFSKSSGSNVFTNLQAIIGTVPTIGVAVGSVVADSSTSKLLFQLTNFLPGTWSAVGNISYELA